MTKPATKRLSNPEAPWWIVEAIDKKQARLNCIQHLVSMIPYEGVYHDEGLSGRRNGTGVLLLLSPVAVITQKARVVCAALNCH
jgi:hypothetical protein